SVIGREHGSIPIHGDFAPWNCAPLGNSRLALWDWEETRLGLPLEDLFYWRIQRLLRFGHGRPSDIVANARDPDPEIRSLCARVGVEVDVAPAALRACLERRSGVGIGTPDSRRLEEEIRVATEA